MVITVAMARRAGRAAFARRYGHEARTDRELSEAGYDELVMYAALVAVVPMSEAERDESQMEWGRARERWAMGEDV